MHMHIIVITKIADILFSPYIKNIQRLYSTKQKMSSIYFKFTSFTLWEGSI